MKVLTASTETNGEHSQDYCFCIPGELLWLPETCDRDKVDPDGPRSCGCSRGFGGLNSHKATTTAQVSESRINREDVEEAIRSSLTDQGWIPKLVPLIDQRAIIDEVFEDITHITDHFPVGSIIRRNGDQVYTDPPARRK